MNHYFTSLGERVPKSVVDSRVRKAKEEKINSMMEEHGYIFCEDCGVSSGTYLDCSHIVSVKKCQENRQTEKAWDVNNIKMLCRKHHEIFDGNGILNPKIN